MRTLGRGAAAMLVLAALSIIVLATLAPDFTHVGPVHVVDWLGLLVFVGAPVTWGTAVIHWAKNYPPGRARVPWGFAVVLGSVPGSIAYWFWGVRAVALPPDSSTGSANEAPPDS